MSGNGGGGGDRGVVVTAIQVMVVMHARLNERENIVTVDVLSYDGGVDA